MEAKGWHPAELARRSESNKVAISRFLRGQSLPDENNRNKLAAALGLPPEELLNVPGRSPASPSQALQLARTLDELMKRLSLTQAELSRRSGISAGSLSQYMRGHSWPEKANLERLATTFGITVGAVEAGQTEAATLPVRVALPPRVGRPSAAAVTAQPFRMNILADNPALAHLRADLVVSSAAAAELLMILARDLVAGRRDAYAPQPVRIDLLPDNLALARIQADLVVSAAAAAELLGILVRDQTRPQAGTAVPDLRVVS